MAYSPAMRKKRDDCIFSSLGWCSISLVTGPLCCVQRVDRTGRGQKAPRIRAAREPPDLFSPACRFRLASGFSLARPRPTPAMALASGTLLGRPAGTARPHLAVSSSSASSIRFPRGGGGGRAVSLRGSSPPGTWSTQMSFLLLPRDWNR